VALAPLPLVTLLPGTVAGRYDYAFAPAGLIGASFLAQSAAAEDAGRLAGKSVGRPLDARRRWRDLLAAVVIRSPWAAAMALILALAACAWDFGGRPALRAVIPPLFLLALCVPLPLDLDRAAIAGLARAAARWASHFLDLLGVAHVRSYQVLMYSGGRLDVADLLGGPFSPFAPAALLLGLALLIGRGFWRTTMLMISGLAFLPVVTAAAAAAQVAWAGGVPEFVWAAGSTALAIGLAISFDQWLGIPTAYDLPPNPVTADVVLTAPIETTVTGGALGRIAAAGFASLTVVQVWAIAVAAARHPVLPSRTIGSRHRSNPRGRTSGRQIAMPRPTSAAPRLARRTATAICA